MPYKLKAGAPLALVKDQQGKIQYHYAHNPLIPWIGDEQLEHLLRNGIVEELDEPVTAATPGAFALEEHKRPAKTAAPEKWVDYGVAQGHNRAELEALDKPDLIDLLS